MHIQTIQEEQVSDGTAASLFRVMLSFNDTAQRPFLQNWTLLKVTLGSEQWESPNAEISASKPVLSVQLCPKERKPGPSRQTSFSSHPRLCLLSVTLCNYCLLMPTKQKPPLSIAECTLLLCTSPPIPWPAFSAPRHPAHRLSVLRFVLLSCFVCGSLSAESKQAALHPPLAWFITLPAPPGLPVTTWVNGCYQKTLQF